MREHCFVSRKLWHFMFNMLRKEYSQSFMSYLCFLALDCGTLLAGKSEKLSKHYTLKVFVSWGRVIRSFARKMLRWERQRVKIRSVLVKRLSKAPTILLGHFRVRFLKEIQDWILKSLRIRQRILRFCTKQINTKSLGSWCVKGTEESTSRRKIHFLIL